MVTLAIALLGAAFQDEGALPESGKLPEKLKFDWTSIADLEALMAGIETEATWAPDPRKKPEKFGVATWGRNLEIELDRSFLFPVRDLPRKKEEEYTLGFYQAYRDLHSRILDQSRKKIVEWDLLPKEKPAEDNTRWIEPFLRKYPPGKPVPVPKNPSQEDLARAETVREMALAVDAVRRRSPIVEAALKRERPALTAELERRDKVLDKYLRRYDFKPLASGSRRGAAICDIQLDPSIVSVVKDYLQRQRVFPILTAEGKPVRVDKSSLYVSADFGAKEVFDLLRDVTHEFFVAWYFEKIDDGWRELLKAVGVRLLKDRVWFLFYNDRVVVMYESGLPGKVR